MTSARANDVKALISFGGGGFKVTSELMGIRKNRQNLIRNIIKFIRENDLDGFSDFIRSIEGVEVALVIYEVDHNLCRMNFRSKGNIIVNEIAKSFGGGGHAFASGAVVNQSLEKAKEVIINNSKKMIQEQVVKIK